MKSFSKWTIEDVEETFQLVLQKDHEQLTAWIIPHQDTSREEEQQLIQLRDKLLDHVWDWNEEELKVYFIIPLLNLVNFEQEYYKPFLDRELSMTFHDETISGRVDFLVASGKRSPKRPFFFIHEYKKERDSSDDPLGQLLIAMVTAQHLNNDGHPVYGTYIMGRYWHFVILAGSSYAVHTGLNATAQEITVILSVLKNTKEIIEQWSATVAGNSHA
jgi:hypothetical protein